MVARNRRKWTPSGSPVMPIPNHMPPNALDYLTIRGFKSIASIEKLPLTACNVLIGPNGSGKSIFIGVFAFLHAIVEGRLRNYVIEAGGAEKVLHFGSKTTSEIHLRLRFTGELEELGETFSPVDYALTLAPTADEGLYPASETLYFPEKGNPNRTMKLDFHPLGGGREAGISVPKRVASEGAEWVRKRLGGGDLSCSRYELDLADAQDRKGG